MTNEKKAILLALLTVAVWSTVASAFKLTLNHFSTELMVFYSSFFSVFVIGIISFFKKTFVFKINPKDLFFSAFAGFINPFLYYLILFEAYDRLPAQSAQAINYTWGITLAIMSFIFLGHKPLKRDYAAIFICYSGVLIIGSKGDFSFIEKTELTGVILALASTVIWASYWIFNTKDTMISQIRLFWNFFFGFIYTGIYILLFKTFYFSFKGIAGSLYIGVFEMGISFFLWLTAMKLTSNASRISNFIYFSPVISLFFINFFVGERILGSTITGLVLIISGLMIQNIKRD
ncbi:MAG: DMT family transporter [Thermodesulfobacteriota bacterium]